MSKLLCLYCPVQLPAKKPAHVVPSAIGGRKTSKFTACDVCNNAIGPTEARIAQAFARFSAGLGSVRGDGQRAPAVEVDHPEHGTVSLRDGRIERAKLQVDRSGEHDGKIRCVAGDIEGAAWYVAHQLRRFKKTPDDLESGAVQFEIDDERVPSGTLPGTVSIGPQLVQPLAKMAIELLACHRPQLARRPELERLRRFVRHGEGELPPHYGNLKWLPVGLLDDFPLPAFMHAVEVWSNGAELISRIVLFGFFEFALVLCSDWQGGPVSVVYAIDPMTAHKLADWAVDQDGPPLDVRNLSMPPEEDFEQAKLGLALSFDRRLRDRGLDNMVHELVEEWRANIATPGKEYVTPEEFNQLIHTVALEWTTISQRLAYKVPIDKAAFCSRVREIYEELRAKDES